MCWLIFDKNFSFQLVESKYFSQFCKTLNPLYDGINRRKLGRTILFQYNEAREELLEEIGKVESGGTPGDLGIPGQSQQAEFLDQLWTIKPIGGWVAGPHDAEAELVDESGVKDVRIGDRKGQGAAILVAEGDGGKVGVKYIGARAVPGPAHE